MLGSLRRKKKGKKEAVVTEAPPVRSFTDPARQIFHELRIASPASTLRGPSSLQGSPRSPRRPAQGGTAPPSLQPSPTLSRREPSPSDIVHGYAGYGRGGVGGPSKTPPRDAPLSGSPKGTPRGSPALSARRSYCAPDGSYLGRGAYFFTREGELLRHVPNNNEAALTQRQPTISSRNTQSEARLNRVMAGSMGLAGSGGANGGGPKMDVVYVTEKIISLAFPPNLDDATYTLHLREVAHMLSSKHGDNFKLLTMSHSEDSESSYYLFYTP